VTTWQGGENLAKRKRKRKKSKRTTQDQVHFDPNVPTYDYFEHIDLDDPGCIDQALDNLIHDIETGYFLQWEGIVRQEQGLPLTKKQKKALVSLISFSDADDDRILYIDEMPRPKEPWYEIARKIALRILREPSRTNEITYWAMHEGWPTLVEILEAHGRDLTLPQGVESPLDIFSPDLQHRLWLQTCFDALSGLGQHRELTLENERQQDRVAWFISLLEEHKDTVQYFDLTLEKLLTRVIMPPKDEEIFVNMMTEQLGLSSPQERLADFL
jgi:hypothetical protein